MRKLISVEIDEDDKVVDISNRGGMLRFLGPPYMMNILFTELCERYSYYALRSILVLFFSGPLGWSDSASVSIVFFSASLTYFTPLLGGWIADAKLGKYKTILRFCMVYIVGSCVLTISAAAESSVIAILGLVAIAIGTGGIKPVVSAFGRDQLEHETPEVRDRFFRVFYFCINVGSVISFIFSPLLKKFVGYPVAFGVPTIFLGIATYTFWAARDSYTKQAPKGSPWNTVIRTIRAARKNKSSDDNTRHWIHNARGIDGCSSSDIYETLAVYRVATVLAIFPIYWTLYDQQGSAWTLQAERMNLYGLEPEQLGVANPLMVLALIPVFDQYIYPNINMSPLFRIGVGMIVSALAFVLSAIVEAVISSSDDHSVSVFLQLPQIFILSCSEILVSITGLEFAYAQAPESMKSIVMALFLLTTAVGDLLGGGLYAILGEKISPAALFLLCAVAMILNTYVFSRVASKFVPLSSLSPVIIKDGRRSILNDDDDDDDTSSDNNNNNNRGGGGDVEDL